ncbi:TPA: glucosaminidase domain-containing protein [Streptococcus pyogenes]|uniref:glycoside hydrolase family 73 protein n=1 Tax=Streptococcus pyogenes TaxID=1314 RepID=UPI000DBE8CA6|nr:glycoside hydrolase family 73 protein [Streptococcus pyogenes]HEQ3638963.1 glycoside hydrolase family 73 protein [Streptococcus pyogenes]HEQ3642276.1 glycoside hydrolase family 73 protein [Streptococcus pyogenes]HEQ3658484.1 glycoside hydrolase family 73 protein [Streptococcus pyogenes]HEQ3665311.1 glycoside hydrolase family 73 protein [Streptococcus pyogenes]HEQ3676893.1 glycoside hydrolase family 73 protein [Streptococcus pyogenes]
MKVKKRRRRAKSSVNRLVLGLVLLNLIVSMWTLKLGNQRLAPYADHETLTFVRKISHAAQSVAQKKQLYSSVMMAQAILESNNGKSQLSQKPYYNFFGIKGSYKERSVIFPTLEDDGQGNLYRIDAAFRSYGSLTACFLDYARVLNDPLYDKTHKKFWSHYQDATATLTGTYATDTTYHTKLNELIEWYQLTNFDGLMK